MRHQLHVLAVLLVVLTVAFSGCAGLGADNDDAGEDTGSGDDAPPDDNSNDDNNESSSNSADNDDDTSNDSNESNSSSSSGDSDSETETDDDDSSGDSSSSSSSGDDNNDDNESTSVGSQSSTGASSQSDSGEDSSEGNGSEGATGGSDDGAAGDDDSTDSSGSNDDDSTDSNDDDSTDSNDDDTDDTDDTDEEDDEEPETRTLEVNTVSHAGDAEPVDVKITNHETGYETEGRTTDGDSGGSATFDIPMGTYEVLGYWGDYVSEEVVTVGDDGATVTLTGPAPEEEPEMYTYELMVEVLDESGEPVEGEEVTIETGGSSETHTTNEHGLVEISFENSSSDDAVEHIVTVRDQTETVHVEEGRTHVGFEVSTESGGGGETYPLTVDAGEALPAIGAEISVAPSQNPGQIIETQTVDESGQVEFTLENGEYYVEGTDVNDNTQDRTVTIDGAGETIMLGGLHQQYPDETELTVEVVDGDGDPIYDALVSGVGGRHPAGHDILVSGTTNSSGIATMTVSDGHNYSLDAQYEGEYSGPVDVGVDGPTEAQIVMDSVDVPTETVDPGSSQSLSASPSVATV